MIYFTADPHFLHDNVIKYENRPFTSVDEMTEAIVKKWNKTVSPKDDIYILGDIGLGKNEKVLDIIRRLNGKKYLILGNHDSWVEKHMGRRTKIGLQLEELFEWIKPYHKLKIYNQKIILCHYPIYAWDTKEHGSWHLHGHTHNNSHSDYFHMRKVNVGMDLWNFTPVSIRNILGSLMDS